MKKCILTRTEDMSFGPAYILIPGVPITENNSGFLVRGVLCSKGKKVIRAFHACRYKNGKKGRCTTKVLGYKCTEKRPASGNNGTEFNATVTCTSGSKKIVHAYQQNLR
jgi:hypothetical protein